MTGDFLDANIPVDHLVWSPGVPDPFGDVTPGWADAVTLLVYAIAPGGSSGNSEDAPGRMDVTTTIQLLAPPEASVGPHDRYLIDGELWEQDGILLDYNRGPFGWDPGIVVNLKRVTG